MQGGVTLTLRSSLSRKRIVLIKTPIFISLFIVINIIYLLTFFSYHHHDHGHRIKLLQLPLLNSNLSLKPWPILPSYLPWSSYGIKPFSCEAIFGNGFTQTINILPKTQSNNLLSSFLRLIRSHTPPVSWFRCHFNPTLSSSICEGGGIRMDPEKIKMSKGGERVEEVMGRDEDDELPGFEGGAFQIQAGDDQVFFWGYGGLKRLVDVTFLDKYFPQGFISRHKMRELVGSIELVEGSKFHCSKWIEEPTLFVTRFEYANLYHAYTDWYNAYVSSRVTGLPGRPNVVFVDGHCKTRLEETWEALFSSVTFAKNFSSPVCFRHAIFVPLGYEMQWFKHIKHESTDCRGTSANNLSADTDDHITARVIEFGEMVKAAFGISSDEPPKSKPSLGNKNVINLLFVRRESYLAHPRQNGNIQSRINEEVLFDALKSWTSNYSKCQVNVANGFFAHLPMKEQIQAVQNSSVVIGGHGAGLAHIITASPNITALLEIRSFGFYNGPHFELITHWKGVEYHPLTPIFDDVSPNEIIELLQRIVHNLGC